MPELTAPQRTRRLVSGVLVLALAGGVVTSATAAEDPDRQKKSIDGQISQSQKDLDGISRELLSAQRTLTSTTARVGAAQKQLVSANKELARANRTNREIGGRLKAAQAAEAKSLKALSTNKAAQSQTKVLVGGLARRSYMKGGLGRLEMTLDILTSDGPDVTNDLTLAGVVVRQQSGVLRTLSGQQSTQKSETARLTGIRTQIAGLKREAQRGVTRASNARDKAQRAKTSLEGLQRSQTKAAGDLAARKKKEESDLRWLRGESTRLGGILRARAAARAKARAEAARKKQAPPPAAAPAARPSDGHFLTGPRAKSQISSPYGYRLHPVLGIRRLHAGSDFSFACGSPVYAAGPGEVISAGYNSIAGNNIIIDHGDVAGVSLATRYEHLSAFAVRSGSVRKGQLIGYVGTTGRSTGCHLHFAVLTNGGYTNPANWIG